MALETITTTTMFHEPEMKQHNKSTGQQPVTVCTIMTCHEKLIGYDSKTIKTRPPTTRAKERCRTLSDSLWTSLHRPTCPSDPSVRLTCWTGTIWPSIVQACRGAKQLVPTRDTYDHPDTVHHGQSLGRMTCDSKKTTKHASPRALEKPFNQIVFYILFLQSRTKIVCNTTHLV
jgi:hypothetical protein